MTGRLARPVLLISVIKNYGPVSHRVKHAPIRETLDLYSKQVINSSPPRSVCRRSKRGDGDSSAYEVLFVQFKESLPYNKSIHLEQSTDGLIGYIRRTLPRVGRRLTRKTQQSHEKLET